MRIERATQLCAPNPESFHSSLRFRCEEGHDKRQTYHVLRGEVSEVFPDSAEQVCEAHVVHAFQPIHELDESDDQVACPTPGVVMHATAGGADCLREFH